MLYSDSLWKNNVVTVPNGIGTLENPTAPHLQLYPNPAQTVIHIRLLNADIDLQQVLLFDVAGQLVLQENQLDARSEISISTTTLCTGFYILKAMDSNGKAYEQRLSVVHW